MENEITNTFQNQKIELEEIRKESFKQGIWKCTEDILKKMDKFELKEGDWRDAWFELKEELKNDN